MCEIERQDALFLLRRTLGHVKLVFALRAGPCFLSNRLDQYDDQQRKTASHILNVCIEETAWLQAALPITSGGIGLQRVSRLALAGFMAGARSSARLVDMLIQDVKEDLLLAQADELYTTSVPGDSYKQCISMAKLSENLSASDKQSLSLRVPSGRETARLLSVTSHEAAMAFSAVPSVAAGARLSDEAVRVAVAMRLGAPVGIACPCQCGSELDDLGDHAICCKRGAARFARNSAGNNIIADSLRSAGLPVRLEPCGLNRTDGKRPDGETLTAFGNGLRLVWDATIRHPLARSNVPTSFRSYAASALAAEESKDKKYSFLSGKAIFAAAAVETLGAFGLSANFLVRRITRWQRRAGSGPSLYSRNRLTRAIVCAVFEGNAACVLDAYSRAQNERPTPPDRKRPLPRGAPLPHTSLMHVRPTLAGASFPH